MEKLNKTQIQAILNTIKRKSEEERVSVTKKEENSYKPSRDAKILKALLDKRDKLKQKYDTLVSDINNRVTKLGLGTSGYGLAKTILTTLKEREIQNKVSNKFQPIDLEAALDDLVIESTKEDFDVHAFISKYVKNVEDK